MNYTLIRNAAAVLSIGGTSFLIDPALDPVGARPPVANTPNQKPNPLVPLPGNWERLVQSANAKVVTHLHKDHFDDTSVAVLDLARPTYCQPEDHERLAGVGFSDLRPVVDDAEFEGVRITRTAGHHGTGKIGEAMAPVSGFVFEAANDSRVYVAGDTIWCDEVAHVIATQNPDVIVVNAGGARFLEGDPIVMTAEDVAEVHRAAPEAMIVIVHLEAINHCLETRSYYRKRLPELGVQMDRVRVPADGESVIW